MSKRDFYLRPDERDPERLGMSEAHCDLLQARLIEAREDLLTVGLIGMKSIHGESFVEEFQNKIIEKGNRGDGVCEGGESANNS